MVDEDEYDPLADLPPESRAEVVAGVLAVLASNEDDESVDVAVAEDVVRAAEPLWTALEEVGLVDTWGGMEFVAIFPAVIEFIGRSANSE